MRLKARVSLLLYEIHVAKESDYLITSDRRTRNEVSSNIGWLVHQLGRHELFAGTLEFDIAPRRYSVFAVLTK